MTFYGYDPALADRSGRGAAQAVRHPPRRPQLVAVEGGRGRAAAGLRADSRSGRRDRVHRPVVGRAACRGAGRRTRSRRSSRIPRAFRRLRIQTPKAVMYHDVIRTMSTARINIFTQRPVLRHLKHLTLKYFEIFCADTIPLLMLDADHARGGVWARRPGAWCCPDRSPRSCSMRCAARTTTGASSKMFAATWSRTIPTTSGSRNWSRRCRN